MNQNQASHAVASHAVKQKQANSNNHQGRMEILDLQLKRDKSVQWWRRPPF